MVTLLSLILFSAALMSVCAVMMFTLVPAMPRIIALFAAKGVVAPAMPVRAMPRRRPVMAVARPPAWRAAA